MFKKVLVAEDFDSISLTVLQSLKELSVSEIDNATYCDDALLKIKRALLDNKPYDLLISDLSFKIDHRITTLKSGEDLIAAVKKIQPNIKVLVFSIEDKSYRIRSLFKTLNIDAFVPKGRDSIKDLKKGITELYNTDTRIVPPELTNSLRSESLIEIQPYDISLLKLLSNGLTVEEIVLDFKKLNLHPNSNSSIEKNINKLKIYLKANNNVHLIAIAKDLGII